MGGTIWVSQVIPLQVAELTTNRAGGIAPPLVMTAISGFGLMITLTPLNT
jgi:hypothetical protein